MAKTNANRQTKMTNTQIVPTKSIKSTYLVPFLATFAGVAFGVLASLGFMAPILKSEIASATKGLGAQVVNAMPASSVTACTGGTGAGSSGGMQTSSATMPGGKGGGEGSGGNNITKNIWLNKFVSGIFATETGTNSNTGPNSHNSVSFNNKVKTTINNTTDINVENNNSQSAQSGEAHSNYNTTGGGATSGAAENTSSSSYDFNIDN